MFPRGCTTWRFRKNLGIKAWLGGVQLEVGTATIDNASLPRGAGQSPVEGKTGSFVDSVYFPGGKFIPKAVTS
jgi:hypothetical protein